MIYTPQEVYTLMDQFGRRRKPFLFVINFEQTEGIFLSNPLDQTDVLFDFRGVSNFAPPLAPIDYSFSFDIEPFSVYSKRFSHVYEALSKGDSFLANLTLKTPIQTSLSLEEIYCFSKASYRLLVPSRFVCFSPEIFVRIDQDGRISSNPMKGTISADSFEAEKHILEDYKESCEHATIVDLIRNDLNRIASKVRVSRYRYIDCLNTSRGGILQVSSEVIGEVGQGYHEHIGGIFRELLPAGSISGAPKRSTIQIIQTAEGEGRGYYTGVAGYYNGTSLDSCVLIRFVEEVDGQKYFRSGGGITINSNAKSEYDEVATKIYLPF